MAKLKTVILSAAVSAWAGSTVSLAVDPNDTLQLRAKEALEQHATLRDLHLWISARDGVVLVTGGVPTAESSKVIEAVMAKVPGVAIVRVNTWVVPPTDPLRKVFAQVMDGPKPPTTTTVQPALAMNPVLPGQTMVVVPPLPGGIGAEPDDRTPGTTVAQKFEPMGGLLLTPVESATGHVRVPAGLDLPPAPAVLPYPTITPPSVPVAPVEKPDSKELTPLDLAMELVKLRQSRPEYEAFLVEVREGVATIGGTGTPKSKVAFREELLRIPGIHSVK